jgi:hypothetical protein
MDASCWLFERISIAAGQRRQAGPLRRLRVIDLFDVSRHSYARQAADRLEAVSLGIIGELAVGFFRPFRKSRKFRLTVNNPSLERR